MSADDIARVAFLALTDKKSHDTDHIILGPDALTYDEVRTVSSYATGEIRTDDFRPYVGRSNPYVGPATQDCSCKTLWGRACEAARVNWDARR